MSTTNETKNRILDAAIELFWKNSYHGVNMNALAKAASVNKATLYQHFASKEDLAVAAVEVAMLRTEDYVYRSAFAEGSNAVERLELIFDKVFALHDEQHRKTNTCLGCPFVNIGVELATSSPTVRDAAANAMKRFQAYFQRIVDDLSANGSTIGQPDRADAAAALMANLNGCLVASKLENRPGAILEGRQRAMRLLAI